MKTDIPDKIYLPVLASSLLNREVLENHWIEVQSPFAKENIAYIRKDVVEHIIRSAVGPQDALNKLRSL